MTAAHRQSTLATSENCAKRFNPPAPAAGAASVAAYPAAKGIPKTSRAGLNFFALPSLFEPYPRQRLPTVALLSHSGDQFCHRRSLCIWQPKKKPTPEAVPLQGAVLCVNCECVSSGRFDECPVCGSRQLLNIGQMLGGDRFPKNPLPPPATACSSTSPSASNSSR